MYYWTFSVTGIVVGRLRLIRKTSNRVFSYCLEYRNWKDTWKEFIIIIIIIIIIINLTL